MKPDLIVRGFIVCLLILSFFTIFNYVNSGTCSVLPKFYVDDDYSSNTPGWQEDHFNTIQDAIDSPNCTSGDRIIVYQGTYNENVVINKSIDLFGEDKENTIIDGGNGPDVLITAENVDISSFTIKDSSAENSPCIQVNADNCKIIDNIIKSCEIGVFVNDSNFVTIAYNSITDNDEGIFFSSSSRCINNRIEHNNIYSNSRNAIYMNDTCNYNVISNNNIYSNGHNGIFLQNHCNRNNISENSIYSNTITGIRIDNCSSNVIYENSKINTNSYCGISISGSNNTIDGNTISNNDKHGIFLIADDDTIVRDNTISSNDYDGIRIHNSTSNIIKSNRVTENSRYGIHVNYYAIHNLIYNNFFSDNDVNARDISSGENLWNVSSSAGSNIINGAYLAGNYWADYSGEDDDNDGVGDSVYSINGAAGIDYLPLMYRLPIADTGGPYSASTFETIQFDGSGSNSPDGTIETYSWDFGDDETGSGKTVSHSYSSAGTYTVTLTIYNNLGGTATDSSTVTVTKDRTPPAISINQAGSSSGLSNVYTYSAYVTDNVAVNSVWMEYWYNGSNGHITASMDNTRGNLYKKVVTSRNTTDRVYCIMYANDSSGNQANTKSPYADIGDPYIGYQVLETIEFNASESYDLDGNITEYSWDFGDSKTDNGQIVEHTFFADGTYTVTLTVTDEDAYTDTKTTTVNINPMSNVTASSQTVNNLENEFNITFTDRFCAYDTDGDGAVDTFSDPSNILSAVRSESFDVNGNISFLLKVNNDLEKIFIWDVQGDRIINATYQKATITHDEPDESTNRRLVKIQVNKAEWTYIEVTDNYPDDEITSVVRSSNTQIPNDMIKRENNKIYILDDPSTIYRIYYKYTPPPVSLDSIEFLPQTGSTISNDNPYIRISFDVAVTIETAEIYIVGNDQIPEFVEHFKDKLLTYDNKSFTYDPSHLKNGNYQIYITAKEKDATDTVSDSASYKIDFPRSAATQQQGFPLTTIIIFIVGTIGLAAAVYFIMKKKNITFESFIYFKNRKIIPFFKPVVFGPVSLKIDDEKISKAEFYINGKLKDTKTSAPYTFMWDEPTMMKHNFETKVYDKDGKENTTGEMTFFVFNPPKFFK